MPLPTLLHDNEDLEGRAKKVGLKYGELEILLRGLVIYLIRCIHQLTNELHIRIPNRMMGFNYDFNQQIQINSV